MNKTVNDLKVEVFDILREQAFHNQVLQDLEKKKNDKLKELGDAEANEKEGM